MNGETPRQPKEEYKKLIDDLSQIVWDELKRNENRSSYNETYERIREKLIAYFEYNEENNLPPRK